MRSFGLILCLLPLCGSGVDVEHLGDESFSIQVERGTGAFVSCTSDGQTVLSADPSIKDVALEGLSGSELVVTSSWQVLPERKMALRRVHLAGGVKKLLKMKGLRVFMGRLTSKTEASSYILAGAFPPIRRFAKFYSEGMTYRGQSYFPFAFVDDGNGVSIMAALNETSPYADFTRQAVHEHRDGISIVAEMDVAGWLKPEQEQVAGDFWLTVRSGDVESHLRATDDWFDVLGLSAPKDRPSWMESLVLYSLYPGGRDEDNRSDRNGFRLSESYLPYLEALGINCIWLRPVEEEKPYVPNDYYKVDSKLGTSDELKSFVAAAHRRNIRVWRDAVIHGGRDSSARAKRHPEWLVRKEDGSHDRIWAYDYNQPTWISAFSNIIADLTREYDLDGWRIDVAGGSREPNWNPDIPYMRGSFSRCQGGLAQQRAIRAAARSVKLDAATLGEVMFGASGTVSDSIYDFPPNLIWFYRFTDGEVGECVNNIRHFLHEQQSVSPPGTLFMHYEENHDSLQASLMYGRAAANALFAMTAWSRGYPLIYQEGEDGCFEAWRRILKIRREIPELTGGTCDYVCVSVPEGVFACLRKLGERESVALVNFTGKRIVSEAKYEGKKIPFDLPPFGYAIVSEKKHQLMDWDTTPWTPPRRTESGACTSVLKRQANGGVERIVRLPGADRWFARTAEGDFESPFFVRHPGYEVAGSSVYHRQQEGAVRWSSSLHPFGLTTDRSMVGCCRGMEAVVVSGFDPSRVEVCVLDRLGKDLGLAISIRAREEKDLSVHIEEMPVSCLPKSGDSLTGIPELTTVMSGWEWQSGDLKVRVQRNGCLRGVWKREGRQWRRKIRSGYVYTNTGIGRKNLFGGRGAAECKQSEEIDCPVKIWRDEKDNVHLKFGEGDLRAYGRSGKMKTPIWYSMHYVFTPESPCFVVECAMRVERSFAVGEGELSLRVYPSDGSCSSEIFRMISSQGAPVTLSESGGLLTYNWLDASRALDVPAAQKNKIRFLCKP